MDIVGLIIQLIAGAVGGNVAGKASPKFDLGGAEQASTSGLLEEWVHAYLLGPGRNPRFVGNHRVGAFEELGLAECWSILWYPIESAYRHHERAGFQILAV